MTANPQQASPTIKPQLTSTEKPWYWKALGLFTLIGAAVGGSSIGVLTNFVPIQTTFAKNAWLSGLEALTFVGPAFLEYRKRKNEVDYGALFSVRQYGILVATLLC